MTDWTDEKKAAALRLVRLRRPHAHPDSLVAKLCDIIDPPAEPRTCATCAHNGSPFDHPNCRECVGSLPGWEPRP